jgi:hypothetical protein
MYQNIFYERAQNLIHLWDDKNGYQTFPYRKYAYKKDPYGQHTSMHTFGMEMFDNHFYHPIGG